MEAQVSKADCGAGPKEVPGANALGPACEDDVFLSPHSDDVCFSLGLQACARSKGTLLTVFPVSSYTAATPHGDRNRSAAITQLRLDEDSVFARAARLRACYLPYQDAQMRGQAPFDPRPAIGLVGAIEARLVKALMSPMIGRRPGQFAWLFCPAAIGGHVDHIAVLLAVLKHRDILGKHYRLAFYEDLHYASDAARRQRGLDNLHRLLPGAAMQHVVWLLDEAQQTAKMRLVRLQRSQLTPQINTIAAFTPAVPKGLPPHEAVWVLQSDRHQRPG